jgi:hypothetical protein
MWSIATSGNSAGIKDKSRFRRDLQVETIVSNSSAAAVWWRQDD